MAVVHCSRGFMWETQAAVATIPATTAAGV
jgi:hypothetical protein